LDTESRINNKRLDLKEVATIEACKRKDHAAFRTLMDRYADFAFTIAFRILHNEEEAKDVVQETFLTVWNKIDNFNNRKPFSNWLYRIIVNKCYDALRKSNKIMIHPDPYQWNLPGLFGEDDPDGNLDRRELGSLIRTFTQQLSRKQKIVFVLSDLQGLSHDEIADVTGMMKTSIKSNLNHARRKIRLMIKKYLE